MSGAYTQLLAKLIPILLLKKDPLQKPPVSPRQAGQDRPNSACSLAADQHVMLEHPSIGTLGLNIIERLIPPAQSPELEQDVVAYAAHKRAQALGLANFPASVNSRENASERLLLNVARLNPRRRVSSQFPPQDGTEILDEVILYGRIMRS